jgi:glycosyltransferase involved in cell wall biosynthesis/SAM-dependent methyltransferase
MVEKKTPLSVVCPVCNAMLSEFQPYGAIPRPNALCPRCGSLERHRLLWLFLRKKTNLFSEKLKVLDIAPTKGLSDNMKAMSNIEYMSIDINSELAVRHMDIAAMDFPDNYFDCVICYHVLEHIPDDRKAMQELFRVMKPGGWAILQVPLDHKLEHTIEGANIGDPSIRKQLFGQEDHLRLYGRDYKSRLECVGFKVEIDKFGQSLSSEEISKFRLIQNENIYFCSKPIKNSDNRISKMNVSLKDNFICHLVYEHDFIQLFNDMVVDFCDWQEHLFVVYANHAWDESKKYNLKNSYYIDSFDDNYVIELMEKSAQIIVHCLYTSDLTSFLFQNQHLLYKVNWKLWGGDLYLYRQVDSGTNPETNEVKRRSIIKNIAYITSPVEEEYKHALDVYGGTAQYKFAFYPLPKDFREYCPSGCPRKDQTINILVGNSGYPTSNHLQALSYLSRFRNEKIKIYCPLSYGDKGYTKDVCANGKKIFGDKFVPLLDFIQFDRYVDLLNTMDIAVMNHDRQQGVGNILMLLYLGKKVYMQPDITTYKCLGRFGVTIYDIEEIKENDFSDFVTFSDDNGKNNSEIIEATYSKENCVKSWQAIFNDAIKLKNSYVTNVRFPQRVLFVNHSIFPFEVSGTPLSTRSHAVGMARWGLEVGVLIPRVDIKNGFRKEQTDDGFTLYQVPAMDKYMAYFAVPGQPEPSAYLQAIEQIIEDFRPQVVHINDFVLMPAEIVEIFSRKGCIIVREVCNCEELCHRDYPVISSGLDGRLCSGPENSQKCANCFNNLSAAVTGGAISGESSQSIYSKTEKRFKYIKQLYQNAVDKVIFTSEPFKTYYSRFVQISEEKMEVIPRGFKFNFNRQTRSGKKYDGVIRFAFIGNIMFSKGIDVALKAFDKICNDYNFVLHIHGVIVNSEYTDWINKLQTNHPGKLFYHGSFKVDELPQIASNVDICIAPSYFDTYNRTVREVLYLGVPVIATDFFGAYIIENGKNGFQIPVGDADALAERMIAIIRDPSTLVYLSRGAEQTHIPSLEGEIDQLIKTYKDIYDKAVETKKAELDKMIAFDERRTSLAGKAVRLIAFYLPQYHPIPENDRWWGKGFTEWNNVAKANPRFSGHYQPHIPGDLGFYDLRSPEVRKKQANLAREYGIEGFCYWHYWFSGKRLLEGPFNEVLNSGEPDYPFCLAWANENWTRTWDGMDKEILQKQEYGEEEDDETHFNYLVKAWIDPRALKIDDKPIFLIYRPADMPDVGKTIKLWRDLAKQAGIKDLYMIAIRTGFENGEFVWTEKGFDGELIFQPNFGHFGEKLMSTMHLKGCEHTSDMVIKYEDAWRIMAEASAGTAERNDLYASVVPSWDNSPRRKQNAYILYQSSPEEYQKWLYVETARIENRPPDKRMVFINAWNEWAEGNHLEPDRKFGLAYLKATRNVCTGYASEILQEIPRISDNSYSNICPFSSGSDSLQDIAMFYEARIKHLEDRLNMFYNSTGGKLLLGYYKYRDLFFPTQSIQKRLFSNISRLTKKLWNAVIHKK